MIPAALLCVIVSGCVDQRPTDPEVEGAGLGVPRIARTDNIPYDRFFTAWSQSHASGQIRTQMFALDARQDRQYVDWYPNEALLAFARANPGRLYINGDEPDQWCMAATEYAAIYNNFVTAVRGADPTARVSPAGFAEPNERCCPPGDAECAARMHATGYADQFYAAYVQRYGAAPPVEEWRFHDFGIAFPSGDVAGWWSRIDGLAAWSVSHGAKMVLGAWGFHGWREPVPQFQEHMKQAMGRLMHDNRINGAVYWAYEPWVETPRPLVNEAGGLTAEGQTFVNPLTDVPTGATIVESGNGEAQLQWANTTSAWPTEVEFWVQTAGSSSFVYNRTEWIGGHGATQSPKALFYRGDAVRGRVRYYNVFGQAEWSPFSNTVLMESGKKRSPLPCFGSKRIQSEPCG